MRMRKASRFVLRGIALFLGSTIVMLPPSTVAQVTLGKVGGNPARAQTLPPKSPPPPPPSGNVQFQDVTDQVGMNTQALKWGDIAVGDYDNSGWDGVYLGHHGICNTAVGQPCTIGGVDGSQTWPKGGQLFHN